MAMAGAFSGLDEWHAEAGLHSCPPCHAEVSFHRAPSFCFVSAPGMAHSPTHLANIQCTEWAPEPSSGVGHPHPSTAGLVLSPVTHWVVFTPQSNKFLPSNYNPPRRKRVHGVVSHTLRVSDLPRQWRKKNWFLQVAATILFFSGRIL